MTEPNLDKEIADYIQKWGDWTGVENYDLQIADLKSLIANQVREARINELKKVASHNNSEYTSDYIEDRIVTLKRVKNK